MNMDINQNQKQPHNQPVKVLLIEDDLIVQRVHTFMLSKMGCRVDIAANGTDALKMASSNPDYKIIFVDIGLPDISGFDVIKQLQAMKNDSIHSAYIVALTGYTGETEEKACKQAGASQIIYKPIVAQTMRELLDQI